MPIPEVLDFEVRKKFTEGIKSGHYFITITVYDKANKKLNHYQVTREFPIEQRLHSLSELVKLISDEPQENNP